MVWATSVNMPAGATVGGKTEAQIGADVQAALAAGDKGKLESILNSLHSAGYSGSFNASQEFKDAGVSNKSMGIVPASVAASPAATAAYVEENQMRPSRPTGPLPVDPNAPMARADPIYPGDPRYTASAAQVGAGAAAGQQGQPNYLDYVLNNPGLRESAEAMGYTQAEMIGMGDWHWNKYGKNESRRNTPFKTELPGERTALPNPTDIANFEASVRRGDPSAMWTARSDIDPAWNLGQFTGQGWNFDPDNPYVSGILGDTIGVDTGVGQIWSEGDPRFLQDRYVDAAIANDFPVGWVGEEGTWKGPDELAGYWSDVTNAIRNEAGDLRAIRDRPSTGWAGTEILDVGPRWSGNVRPGVGVGNVYGTGGYTQPAPLDWSAIRPEVSYTPQFEALTGNLMSNWQPWAMGQATPPGLLNYQIPGVTPSVGTSPNVTYTGGNPSLFNTDTSGSAFASGSTTTDTSGTKWVMTPGGQWVKASSEYGQGLLGNVRLFGSGAYDSSGAYVGPYSDRSIMRAPPGTLGGVNSMVYVDSPINTGGVISYEPVQADYFGTPWQDTIFANPIATHWGINLADQRTDAEKASQVAGVVEPTAETGYESDWSGL